ncbi:MAG: VWA domain-containing protein [Acidobacteriota bacterium]
MQRMGNQLLFLTMFCLVIFVSAGAQEQPTNSSEEVIKLSTELVVLDVQVLNKETGLAISGLSEEDFELYEDGTKQTITNFSQDKLPLSIILLLDVSGSVRPILEQIRDGALDALQQLKPEDEVALMAFAGKTELIANFTRDRQLIADRIKNINQFTQHLGAATFLNEGVYQAALQLRKSSNPISRRVIIVVTDNVSNRNPFGKEHSEKEALAELFESGGAVCGLIVRGVIGKVMAKNPTTILSRVLLSAGSVNTYAKKTGGEVMPADKNEVDTKLGQLITHLRTRYSIGYVSSNTKQDGRFRRIKLKLVPRTRKSRDELVIRTKEGYYASRTEKVGNDLTNKQLIQTVQK